MRGYPSWGLPDRPDDVGVAVRTARSRGHAISYGDIGAGNAVVLIPGYTMSAADWRDCGYVDRLASSRRVLTVDPLGHGLSDTPHDPEAYRYPAVAADVVAAMDAAGVDRAAVWGYSRGAGLAGIIAAEFPDRVAALVLGGADLTDVRPPGTPPPSWAEALAGGDWGPLWDLFAMPEEDRQYCAEVNDPRAFGAAVMGARESGLVIDVTRIVAPALVYCGGNDEPDAVKQTAAALGVELHVLPGLDHSDAFAPVGGRDSTVETVIPWVVAHLEAVGL